jgi:hypothetical protein
MKIKVSLARQYRNALLKRSTVTGVNGGSNPLCRAKLTYLYWLEFNTTCSNHVTPAKSIYSIPWSQAVSRIGFESPWARHFPFSLFVRCEQGQACNKELHCFIYVPVSISKDIKCIWRSLVCRETTHLCFNN